MKQTILNQNGAISLESSGSSLLDLFSKIGAMRKATTQNITALFEAAYKENPEYALRCLLWVRDVRGGQGEREVFKTILNYLAFSNRGQIILNNLNKIIDIGRWDDITDLLFSPIEKEIAGFIRSQLQKDTQNLETKLPVSLCAKWMPSANTSSKTTVLRARQLIKLNGFNEKAYRQNLSQLRQHISILETKMCSNEFGSIDYEKLPAQAGIRHRKAFLKKDGQRYRAYLGEVTSGKKEIKTKVLYPYDIVKSILGNTMHKVEDSYYVSPIVVNEDNSKILDLYWRNLPNYFQKPENCIAVVDTSGSMRGLPIQVAVSLGIYLADKNQGAFKDHFITFSETPEIQKISGDNIVQKVSNIAKTKWGANTNLIAVFETVLKCAVQNKLPKSAMPSKIFIISDMQFDVAVKHNDTIHFNHIKSVYANSGYDMPELVFWNVNAGVGSPVSKDERGVTLVSGCNPNILRQVLSGINETPMEKMIKVLANDRYTVTL